MNIQSTYTSFPSALSTFIYSNFVRYKYYLRSGNSWVIVPLHISNTWGPRCKHMYVLIFPPSPLLVRGCGIQNKHSTLLFLLMELFVRTLSHFADIPLCPIPLLSSSCHPLSRLSERVHCGNEQPAHTHSYAECISARQGRRIPIIILLPIIIVIPSRRAFFFDSRLQRASLSLQSLHKPATFAARIRFSHAPSSAASLAIWLQFVNFCPPLSHSLSLSDTTWTMNRADTSLQLLLQLRDHTGHTLSLCVCAYVWIAVLLATMYHQSGGFCEAVIDRNSLHAAATPSPPPHRKTRHRLDLQLH